jgi:hypothetical protein
MAKTLPVAAMTMTERETNPTSAAKTWVAAFTQAVFTRKGAFSCIWRINLRDLPDLRRAWF